MFSCNLRTPIPVYSMSSVVAIEFHQNSLNLLLILFSLNIQSPIYLDDICKPSCYYEVLCKLFYMSNSNNIYPFVIIFVLHQVKSVGVFQDSLKYMELAIYKSLRNVHTTQNHFYFAFNSSHLAFLKAYQRSIFLLLPRAIKQIYVYPQYKELPYHPLSNKSIYFHQNGQDDKHIHPLLHQPLPSSCHH